VFFSSDVSGILFIYLHTLCNNIMHKHHYIPLQIWNLGSPDPNFTLDAHQKGVNCVDYFTGGDKPYLITGSDDHTAKV
jgi:WD40 repeat protein